MTARRDRLAARILVLDPEDHLLLFRFTPDDRPPFWATVGGELDPGESYHSGARRELFEETGLDADPGGPFATRESDFTTFGGEPVHAIEQYFAVRAASRALDFAGHTELERAVMRDHRWWPIDDLRATDEIVFPPDIADLATAAIGMRSA